MNIGRKKNEMDISKCDITNESGVLRLVYNSDDYAYPLTLAHARSYHELNEAAMKLFNAKAWVSYIIQLNIDHEEPILRTMLADIYKNYHDLYEKVLYGSSDDADTPECDDEEEEEDENTDDVIGTLSLTDTGRKTENGHRIGRFDMDSLMDLDKTLLRLLAESCGIENADTMSWHRLLLELVHQDIDIDDECDCDDCDSCDCDECDEDDSENAVDECDCHDECDGGCKNCEYTDLDDRSEEEKHPDWPHPIKEDNASQNNAQQYEYVDGPAHYHGTECIENMRKLFGDEAVRWFCICNAYKYRFRDGSKPGVSAEQDHEKAHWYEDYAVKMMGEQRYY